VEQGRKTISGQDVIDAMDEMEFPQFVEPLQQAFASEHPVPMRKGRPWAVEARDIVFCAGLKAKQRAKREQSRASANDTKRTKAESSVKAEQGMDLQEDAGLWSSGQGNALRDADPDNDATSAADEEEDREGPSDGEDAAEEDAHDEEAAAGQEEEGEEEGEDAEEEAAE
jgi:hypothetical protein